MALFSLARTPVPLLSPPSYPSHQDARTSVPNMLLNPVVPPPSHPVQDSEGEDDIDRRKEETKMVRSGSFIAAKTLESLFFSTRTLPPIQLEPRQEFGQKQHQQQQQQIQTPSYEQPRLRRLELNHTELLSRQVILAEDQEDSAVHRDPNPTPQIQSLKRTHGDEEEDKESTPLPPPTKKQRKPRTPPSPELGLTTVGGRCRCEDCGEQFAASSELRRHQKVAHQRQTFKCRTCGLLFSSIADRQTHKNNKHFSTVRIELKNANFRLAQTHDDAAAHNHDSGHDPRFLKGTVVESTRNANGQFACPAPYCSFVTRIPGYWYEHVNGVEHLDGVDPQKRKRRKGQ